MSSSHTPASQQFELFTEFQIGSPQARLSRIIPLTDLLGVYLFSRNNAVPPNTPASAIRPRHHQFVHRDENISFEVRPAILAAHGGKTKVIFPGEREQLVASAIRALAVRGDALLGTKPGKGESYLVTVTLTIRQLRAELASTGHTFSHAEVMEALEILGKTSVSLTRQREGEKPIKMDYSLFTSQMSQEDNYLIVLSELESQQIVAGAYRSLNYPRMMQLADPLARWLYQYIHSEHRGARKSRQDQAKSPFVITLHGLIARGVISETKELRKAILRVRRTLETLADAGVLDADDTQPGFVETIAKTATGGRAKIAGAEWSLLISDSDTDGIIDANSEAMYRSPERRHIPARERLRATEQPRRNLERAAAVSETTLQRALVGFRAKSGRFEDEKREV